MIRCINTLCKHSSHIQCKKTRTSVIISNNFITDTTIDDKTNKRLQEERTILLSEARFMTLSLWRTCLRCIRAIRPGNEHDEMEFQEREEQRLNSSKMTFEMPVDREDELASRANYYYQWTLENVQQESDCLDRDPWLEADVERYTHLVREGEERRKWILRDYKFDDPYPQSFDHDRMDRFEKRANEFLKESYKLRGWSMKNDSMIHDSSDGDEDDDDFFDEDDEPRPR